MSEYIKASELNSAVTEVKHLADVPVCGTFTVYGSDDFEWLFSADKFDHYTADELKVSLIDRDEDTHYIRVQDVLDRLDDTIEYDGVGIVYTKDIMDVFDANTTECEEWFYNCLDMASYSTPTEAIGACVSMYLEEVKREAIDNAKEALADMIS